MTPREPLQNRVFPDGSIAANPERGLFMGNRGGRIHDPVTRRLTSRRFSSRAWICCVLEFKGRRETVWGPGYTQLFFLDEVTALAAGHRPCFECRRGDAVAFAEAVARADGVGSRARAPELDLRLHAERLDGRAKRLHERPLAALPDGAMLARDGDFLAVRGNRLLRWSPGGYVSAGRRSRRGDVRVLTPPTVLDALALGYEPAWHPSAAAVVGAASDRRAGSDPPPTDRRVGSDAVLESLPHRYDRAVEVGTLHHVAMAVEDLDAAVETYRRLFGAEIELRGTLEDQGVEAVYLQLGGGRVELMAALAEDTPVGRFLARRGPGMHHVAFKVEDVDAAVRELALKGANVIDLEPRPGLGGHLVSFVHPESIHGVLVEVVAHG